MQDVENSWENIDIFVVPGYPLHRENRGGGGECLSGKTQGIWKFCQKTRNLVCLICKFHDSKGEIYLFEIWISLLS